MEGIEKRFPGVHALKNVRFDLKAGEVHALMGENGAGKSTLVKILSGVYRRDEGTVHVDEKPADFDGPGAAQDAGVGIIHQELSLMNDLTAAQNIFIGREPRLRFGRLDDAALNRQAADIFAQMNLKMDTRMPVHQMTIAKQQMVEIAKDTPIADIIQMMVGRALSDSALDLPAFDETDIALDVKGLSRASEIRDVSFTVRKGEILGFAGLMGAGRTEVARAIFGADPIDGGSVSVHGREVDIKSPTDAVAAGIGYLSEDRKHFGLATGMDVRANIAMTDLTQFSSRFGVLDESAMQASAQHYIERLGIRTPSDQQEVRLLSGGNQQKVVIAKWLLKDCDVLIFDEPTRGIDVGAKAEIYKLLIDLADQGRAIIVISSELPEVLRISHRIAVMCEGRLTGILDRQEATQETIMNLATNTVRASSYTMSST